MNTTAVVALASQLQVSLLETAENCLLACQAGSAAGSGIIGGLVGGGLGFLIVRATRHDGNPTLIIGASILASILLHFFLDRFGAVGPSFAVVIDIAVGLSIAYALKSKPNQ
jgi:cation transporter-like permease